jgi:hypothetical protein
MAPRAKNGIDMTEQQHTRLTELSAQLRQIAEPNGSMHGFWDLILDIEAILAGKPTLLTMTPEEWIAYAEECLPK